MKKIAAIALTAVLTACGGGDGGDSPAKSVGAAEGLWSGTSSTGFDVALAVLENGETWGVYASGGTLMGAINGTTTINGSSFSGSGRDYDFIASTVTPGTYSGSVVAKSTISLATSGNTSITASYDATYDLVPSLTTVAGNFSGDAIVGLTGTQSVPVTIDVNGVITVPTSGGCSTTGRITPRSSGKNVYNVSVTFTGSGCALGNGANTSGIAYYDAGQVLVLALTPDKSTGFVYLGTKL